MDASMAIRPSKSTSKGPQPRRLEGKQAPKNKRSLPTNSQILCNPVSPTKNSDHCAAADIVVPRNWVNAISETATQQIVDIISLQGEGAVSGQDVGPQAPPSQPPFPPIHDSPSINTMQEWLEEPNRSQPFNNIEAFPGSVTNDRQSSKDVGDEEYTVEGWSVAYYVREDSPGHMMKRI